MPESRNDRRKRETREKLLQAAFGLMAVRGKDPVSIQEITDAADVGFGTFYNHFESKDAIYDAVVEDVFEDFGDALDRLVADVADPAEVIAVSVRHTVARASREPTWGRFLLREGFSRVALSRGLGPRLLQDIQRGLASGRFSTPDLPMAFLSAAGTVLATIAAQLRVVDAQALGLDAGDLAERCATSALQCVGLAHAEAAAVSRLPLPDLAV